MNADELRDRLAEADPAHDVATEPPTTSSSRSRLERIMHTDPDPTTANTSTNDRRPRLPWVAAAAAVVVAVAGGVAVAAGGGGDEPAASGPPLELSLGASDTMASCLPVEAEILADMPVAFAGTATHVDGDTVTLTVDEWYAGGDAGSVVLRSQSGMEALIDGFAFEEDGRYLVAATDGTVNFCGFSGPATGELQAVYDDAFRR